MTVAGTAPGIRWPQYREGSLLDVAELQAEQDSRAATLTRHVGEVHTAGVAVGLELRAFTSATDVGVEVWPGLAVDGTGRCFGLAAPWTASLQDGETRTVSIIWRAGAGQIELSALPPPPPADRTGGAWPVVLGSVKRAGGTVTVRSDTREQLELRATSVTPPAGGSRVVLGGGHGYGTQVLGVQLARDGAGYGNVTTVDADGTTQVSADTGISRDITSGQQVILNTPGPAPTTASPWSLYRASSAREDKSLVEQLRLEVGEVKSGINPHSRELAVVTGGAATSRTLLRVDAGSAVTIPGKLVVKGFTAFIGYANPLQAATTLTDLVAQEADLLARAQVLLNQLTDKDLKAIQQVPWKIVGTSLTYTLRLVSSATAAVRTVSAYETVVAGSNVTKGFVAQGVDLPAGAARDVPRTIDVSAIPVGMQVAVTVIAIGVGPDGQPRTGTLRIQAVR